MSAAGAIRLFDSVCVLSALRCKRRASHSSVLSASRLRWRRSSARPLADSVCVLSALAPWRWISPRLKPCMRRRCTRQSCRNRMKSFSCRGRVWVASDAPAVRHTRSGIHDVNQHPPTRFGGQAAILARSALRVSPRYWVNSGICSGNLIGAASATAAYPFRPRRHKYKPWVRQQAKCSVARRHWCR
jgi:hypothetical protein